MKIVHVSTYLWVFFALLVLLVVTVAVGRVDLGIWNPFIALLIAAVKAVLVVYFFMHVGYGSRLTGVFAGAGFLWLFLLLVILFADYLARYPL